jgi:transcriptional regulator with XRE-family HTH domain
MGSVRDVVFENLIKNIKSSGMEQKQIAEKLGVSPAAVTNWMMKKNTPDIEMLFLICKLLNVSINEMLGQEEKPAANMSDEPLQDDDKAIICLVKKMTKEQKRRFASIAGILLEEDIQRKE